jgi:stearoyl-CoA desaturase (delta-9 desaturase)
VTTPTPDLSLRILLPYVMVHVACLGVIWTGVTWSAVGLCVGSYFIRTFLGGLSYHRYFAHRSYRTSRAFQFLLGIAGAFLLQGGPLWWAATHRHHHRHADTPDDLHSPRFHGFVYSHAGWFADRRYLRTEPSLVQDLAKFPELVWLDTWHPVFMIVLFGAMYFAFGWTGVVWGGCLSSVLVWQATHCIQSVSHAVGGYRRYPSPDDSRNHLLIGLLTLGEWHNNHHTFPGSARQGLAWWEVDPVYYALVALSWLGLVWDLKVPGRGLNCFSSCSPMPPRGVGHVPTPRSGWPDAAPASRPSQR